VTAQSAFEALPFGPLIELSGGAHGCTRITPAGGDLPAKLGLTTPECLCSPEFQAASKLRDARRRILPQSCCEDAPQFISSDHRLCPTVAPRRIDLLPKVFGSPPLGRNSLEQHHEREFEFIGQPAQVIKGRLDSARNPPQESARRRAGKGCQGLPGCAFGLAQAALQIRYQLRMRLHQLQIRHRHKDLPNRSGGPEVVRVYRILILG
jgi:hypothetical protein